MKQMKRVAILTGGGDCPGLNAVIRAAAKTLMRRGIEPWGVQNGFKGLVENQMLQLTPALISGILPRGGTILGTTNRDNPFHYKVVQNGLSSYADMSDNVLVNLQAMQIDGLVVIGGDCSLKIASEFCQKGVPIVAVPKTIDNDIPGTERTFGFDTAVNTATEALDRLHTTAESHHRVMVLEVMGRYAGWIALHAGIAGGADCIMIPEIPYNLKPVLGKITERCEQGKSFSIIVIAEGAMPVGGQLTVERVIADSPEPVRLGGVGEKLTRMIEAESGLEARCTVLGHLQRGGSPTPFDRVLSTRYGVAAVDCLLDGQFGHMVALQQNLIVRLPIVELAGKENKVPVAGEMVQAARSLGICFGDE